MDKHEGIRPAPISLLSVQVWLSLPQEQRNKLIQLFGLKKSGTTQVDIDAGGAKVISDGHTPGDLLPINTEAMQKMLSDDSEDFYKLFGRVVENVDALIDGTYAELIKAFPPIKVKGFKINKDEIIEPGKVVEMPPKKRGRPKGSRNIKNSE